MGGKVLELPSVMFYKQGHSDGLEEGREEGREIRKELENEIEQLKSELARLKGASVTSDS